MEFIKNTAARGLLIPLPALKLCGFQEGDTVELNTTEGVLVVMKGRMTAMELLTTVERLRSVAGDLLDHLADVCGPCEDCEGCEGSCPYDDLDDEAIKLPGYLRQAVGIPEEAKLCAEVNEEAGTVTVSAAEHRYDLRDLSRDLVDAFAEAGVCLGELEEHLILEDTIYGK